MLRLLSAVPDPHLQLPWAQGFTCNVLHWGAPQGVGTPWGQPLPCGGHTSTGSQQGASELCSRQLPSAEDRKHPSPLSAVLSYATLH